MHTVGAELGMDYSWTRELEGEKVDRRQRFDWSINVYWALWRLQGVIHNAQITLNLPSNTETYPPGQSVNNNNQLIMCNSILTLEKCFRKCRTYPALQRGH